MHVAVMAFSPLYIVVNLGLLDSALVSFIAQSRLFSLYTIAFSIYLYILAVVINDKNGVVMFVGRTSDGRPVLICGRQR